MRGSGGSFGIEVDANQTPLGPPSGLMHELVSGVLQCRPGVPMPYHQAEMRPPRPKALVFSSHGSGPYRSHRGRGRGARGRGVPFYRPPMMRAVSPQFRLPLPNSATELPFAGSAMPGVVDVTGPESARETPYATSQTVVPRHVKFQGAESSQDVQMQ